MESRRKKSPEAKRFSIHRRRGTCPQIGLICLFFAARMSAWMALTFEGEQRWQFCTLGVKLESIGRKMLLSGTLTTLCGVLHFSAHRSCQRLIDEIRADGRETETRDRDATQVPTLALDILRYPHHYFEPPFIQWKYPTSDGSILTAKNHKSICFGFFVPENCRIGN